MQDLHEFSYIYNSTRYLPTSHIRTQIASSLKRLLFNQKCENNETTSVWSLTSYHNQILVSKWRVRNFFICLKSAPYEIPVWGQIPVGGRYVIVLPSTRVRALKKIMTTPVQWEHWCNERIVVIYLRLSMCGWDLGDPSGPTHISRPHPHRPGVVRGHHSGIEFYC